jgi:hypothetical protein
VSLTFWSNKSPLSTFVGKAKSYVSSVLPVKKDFLAKTFPPVKVLTMTSFSQTFALTEERFHIGPIMNIPYIKGLSSKGRLLRVFLLHPNAIRGDERSEVRVPMPFLETNDCNGSDSSRSEEVSNYFMSLPLTADLARTLKEVFMNGKKMKLNSPLYDLWFANRLPSEIEVKIGVEKRAFETGEWRSLQIAKIANFSPLPLKELKELLESSYFRAPAKRWLEDLNGPFRKFVEGARTAARRTSKGPKYVSGLSLSYDGAQPNPEMKTLPFDKNIKVSNRHAGQDKLLLSEIEYLVHIKAFEKTVLVIYPGGGPGVHLPILALLFPTTYFVCIDPAFDGPLPHFRGGGNVYVIPTLFDVEVFMNIGDLHDVEVVLVSDIRSSPERIGKRDPGYNRRFDDEIRKNMTMQMEWFKALRRVKKVGALFKFRLTYERGTQTYLGGKLKFQVFEKETSSELRLHIYPEEDFTERVYDRTEVEERMFYFNVKYRPFGFSDDFFGFNYDILKSSKIVSKYLSQLFGKLDRDEETELIASLFFFFDATLSGHRKPVYGPMMYWSNTDFTIGSRNDRRLAALDLKGKDTPLVLKKIDSYFDFVGSTDQTIPPYPTVRKFRTIEDVRKAWRIIESAKFDLIIGKRYVPSGVDYLTDDQLLYPINGPRGLKDYVIVKVFRDDYWDADWVSDWFQHSERIKARRIDEEMTPLEWWEHNYEGLLDKSPSQQESIIYKNVMGCGNFRPLVYAGLIDFFGAKKILDPCSGWGDRLIASLAKHVEEYRGFDPNTSLQKGYQEIKKQFDPKETTMASVEPIKFEDSDLPSDHFDLVATSPPYFDLELYKNGPDFGLDQEARERWSKTFLRTMLEKSRDAVTSAGKVVIIVGDTKKISKAYSKGRSFEVSIPPLVKATLREAQHVGLRYVGVISFNELSPQGMYVFAKN